MEDRNLLSRPHLRLTPRCLCPGLLRRLLWCWSPPPTSAQKRSQAPDRLGGKPSSCRLDPATGSFVWGQARSPRPESSRRQVMTQKKTDNLGSNADEQQPSSRSGSKRIRLPKFIHENEQEIVDQWEAFARTLAPSSANMAPLALRDHIHELLEFIVEDITLYQTPEDQTTKSQGKQPKSSVPSAAEIHAALRLAGGFDIEQMVSEYRALRASIIKIWCTMNDHMDATDIDDLTRFNEAIDQQLAESVSHYTQKVSHSKDLFVGILGHDLRNPLHTITMCAELILDLGKA